MNANSCLADIPGLIEGAHEGAGLGTKFLGHVERCRVLLHLIDGTQEDVAGAYKTIRKELKAYSAVLAAKTELVALNKCDALTEEEIEEKAAALKKAAKLKKGQLVYRVSGAAGINVTELMRTMLGIIDTDKAREAEEAKDMSQGIDIDARDSRSGEMGRAPPLPALPARGERVQRGCGQLSSPRMREGIG